MGGTMARFTGRVRRAAGVAVCLAVVGTVSAGCSPIMRNHGYTPADDQLAEITVGKDTRDTVAEKIGQPFNIGVGDGHAWYYISSTDRTFGVFRPKTVRRDIVAIRFTKSDTVENIERFDVSDGRVVRLTARVTNSAVSEVGILRQIFGSVGTPNLSEMPGAGGG